MMLRVHCIETIRGRKRGVAEGCHEWSLRIIPSQFWPIVLTASLLNSLLFADLRRSYYSALQTGNLC